MDEHIHKFLELLRYVHYIKNERVKIQIFLGSLPQNFGERIQFVNFFQQYKDIFAWKYEDIKMYDTRIIHHIIPIKVSLKPFQQQLRKMHPKLEPLIQNEVKKLLDAKIIFRLRHSEWVSNLVPMRKKSKEIRLCVDFQNLNRNLDKDNYPVPPMEQILQMVSSSELFSLLVDF